ncbi:MAG: ABC transporter ATP-binding protein, partial [Planctomycetes bacterium]|nr:ABC transporter ATP-binding protein [Planctomycetota bacterium]
IRRALALAPRLIVLDEAVSALDVSIRAQILNLLLDLQRELGLAYLFITHDLALARVMAARVAVMEQGRIVECGATEDVLVHPEHPATRRLLACVLSGDPRRRRTPALAPGQRPARA